MDSAPPAMTRSVLPVATCIAAYGTLQSRSAATVDLDAGDRDVTARVEGGDESESRGFAGGVTLAEDHIRQHSRIVKVFAAQNESAAEQAMRAYLAYVRERSSESGRVGLCGRSFPRS